MPKVEAPFALQEGKSGARQNSQETLINVFAEIETSQGARSRITRRQRPCLDRVLAQAGEKRCIERHRTTYYAIIADGLYSFNGTALTLLGTIGTVTGRCYMIFNDNDEILISDGENGYVWDGSAMSNLSMPDDAEVGSLAYLGGYGIIGVPDTGRFYITDLNDFKTVDSLNFATAESNADNLLRVFVDHNELWLFGPQSVEIWTQTSSADFPFAPATNAAMERGLAAALAVCAEDNTVFWLGDDLVVYRADGYRPMRISTHPVERAIAAVPLAARNVSYMLVYTVEGHKFVTLVFPEYLTLQFNVATGLWNRAETFGYDDWRVIGSNGYSVPFLMTEGGICRPSFAINQDEGGVVSRRAISAPVHAEGRNIVVNSFWLDAQVGHSGANKPANVMLRIARDGETFGNQRVRSLGEPGDYQRRAIWRGCGVGRRMVFEVSMTDDTPFIVMSTYADLKVAAY